MAGAWQRWHMRVLTGLCALAAALVLLVGLDLLFPPDLSRARDTATLVLDRRGAVLRGFPAIDGAWRLGAPPEAVSPAYLAMLTGYEDRRFPWHPGVDPLALLRAAGQMLWHGRVVSGGSTLTMQVARLLEPSDRTLVTKLREMARALQLEARLSKREILTLYLTLAPFGGNIEGVRAASLFWFGREPAHLTPGQAALLVALPQSPTRRRPDADPAAARAGRDQVLARVGGRGLLTGHRLAEALAEPLPTARRPLPFLAPHLAERLRRETGAGGGEIRTTLDATLQAAVEAVAAEARRGLEPRAEVAVLVLEQATGAVAAYVGGSFDGPAGQVDMVRAVRSPGSTLKPFIYGLGFETLPLHPESWIDDRPMAFGGWQPRNFDDRYRGTLSVRRALQWSVNVPAVAVLAALGPTRLLARLEAAGARLHLPDPAAGPGLPLALGGVGISLEDLTGLYAALARGGRGPAVQMLPGPAVPRGRLLSERAAWYVADILAGAPRPDGRAPGGLAGRVLAYKTGTSYGFRDAWSVGFNGSHTIGVWVGRPDGTPRPGSLGRDVAAPILFRIADLLPDTPLPPAPAGALVVQPGDPVPAGLRHFGRAADRVDRTAPLQIAFPPDGARLDLAAGGGFGALPLEAMGGRAPLRWLVNGLPVAADHRGRAHWQPDGPGFVDITLLDAAGQRVTAQVRVE